MRNRGQEFTAGRVTYLFDGLHLWYSLPSGRVLCYPFARLEDDGISYAKAAWKPAQDAKEWPRARLWRGLACENVTQAVANDLLRYAMRTLDSEGFEIILTVHDEIVLECPIDDVEKTMQRLEQIMCTPPEWAQGIPLGVECASRSRYGK
jgi:DNA polymerase